MSNISALLNPEPTHQDPSSRSPPPPTRNSSMDSYVATTTIEAADALTTLATLGSNAPYATTRELPSPVNFRDGRRQSSFGSHASHAAPVEPSPPLEPPQPHSPTLEQYHHGSKSPEEQRRQSLIARSSPAPVLAPIQSLTGVLNDQFQDGANDGATSYGQDISQNVHISRGSEDRAVDSTQDREPAFVRDEPTVTQIRAPSEGYQSTPHLVSTAIPLTNHLQPSPAPMIKHEPSGSPVDGVPLSDRKHSIIEAHVDAAEALKAFEAVKQSELGLRAKSGRDTATPAVDALKVDAAPSKKRPAPKSSAAANKKGTASTKKPAAKKRKVDPESSSVAGDNARRSSTPASRTSKTPATKTSGKKGSQNGTPAGSSPVPDRSSQAPASEDEGSASDDGVYCVCRKPDDHKFMIGCEGGCDDWFHGACVNITKDEGKNLVERFVCPNCERDGKGATTWKRTCRRDGCKNPARMAADGSSKYCSEECGVQFFQQTVSRKSAGAKDNSAPKGRKSKKKTAKDHEEDVDMGGNEEEEPVPLGGVLRARDLKSLTMASKDLEEFRRLGSGVLSPPQTASPTKASFPDMNLTNGTSHISDIDPSLLTQAEIAHLGALNTEKTELQAQLAMLNDRSRFVSLVREAAARYAERENIRPKEFCGYDSRLSWSETEFVRWRSSKVGKASLLHSTSSPTKEQLASIEGADEDEEMDLVNGDRILNGVDTEKVEKEPFCTKKRCNKHANWQKLNVLDARFEELEVTESIKKVEREEKDVKERALLRWKREQAVKDVAGDDANVKRDGWVEVAGV